MRNRGFGAVGVFLIVGTILALGLLFWIAVRGSLLTENNGNQETVQPLPEQIEGLVHIGEVAINLDGYTEEGVASAKLKQKDIGTVYEIYLADGRVLTANAISGEFVSNLATDASTTEQSLSFNELAELTIGFEGALSTAKLRHQDAAVEYVELKLEEGTWTYLAQFIDGTRINIDPGTGEITRFRDSEIDIRPNEQPEEHLDPANDTNPTDELPPEEPEEDRPENDSDEEQQTESTEG